MKNILIAGASGMIGGLILKECLASSEVHKVTSLVRRKSGMEHPKLNEVVIENFAQYENPQDHFKNIDSAFFCVGVYTGSVPDNLFKEITVDYAVQFAKMLKQYSPNARFCLLSGAGADRKEKSKTAFALYKGMAENQVDALGLEFYSFRPAYIYPVAPRKEPNAMYSIMRKLYPVIKWFGRNASIQSTELARAMFHVGLHGTGKSILENKDIVNYVEG